MNSKKEKKCLTDKGIFEFKTKQALHELAWFVPKTINYPQGLPQKTQRYTHVCIPT